MRTIKNISYSYYKRKNIVKKIMLFFVMFILSIVVVTMCMVTKKKHDFLSMKPADMHEVGLNRGVRAKLGVGDYAIVSDFPNNIDEVVEEVVDIYADMPEGLHGNDWFNENKFELVDNYPLDYDYFDKTVFIGDSRTEGLLLYSGVANLNGFCYKGLSLDKLKTDRSITVKDRSGRFTCYEAIEITKYGSYYIMFGINELGWSDFDIFIEYFNQLIDKIISVNPRAVIYVESILPVTKSKSQSNSVFTKENVDTLNQRLLDMCSSRGDVIYLDIASSVSDEEGYLKDEWTVDGVHCTADACKKIIEYIRYHVYKKK